jgi:transposase-like protein
MAIDHLNGFSFSVLGTKYLVSKMTAWRVVMSYFRKLIHNNLFTFTYCNRFSSVLVPDGKYVPIKGYSRDAVLLWGVDYFYHDFPLYFLAPSENWQSWELYFKSFDRLHHRYQIVTCDDNTALKESCKHYFPNTKIQACYNHIKEQVRRELKIRSSGQYREFFRHLSEALDTTQRIQPVERKLKLAHMLEYSLRVGNTEEVRVLLWLQNHFGEELFNYHKIPRSPLTSNIQEGFNQHLETRIRAIKGFESYEHADLWLNAYILKRRFTKYTECGYPFQRLNGKRPIDQTRNLSIDIPVLF